MDNNSYIEKDIFICAVISYILGIRQYTLNNWGGLQKYIDFYSSTHYINQQVLTHLLLLGSNTQ